ncbi:MAG TPA: efflux RND transporter permease subunit, partial [Pilimelia sp.]|nr:efflux RND transporter permease subunit [Pilimelia sp.]
GPTQVRLRDVADVRVVAKPEVISHDQVSRSIDVVANVRGRSLCSVTDDVRDRVREVSFPREHHLEVLGEAEERTGHSLRVWAYVIGAAVLIFFLLQAAFGSWRLAALYFLALPAALAGGLLLAAAIRGTVSVIALLGLLTVLAMAVRGAITQVRHYQRLADDGRAHDSELVALGSAERFVPSVTGLVAGALALVPLVIYGSASGLEIASPLALIIVAGLITTAALNLFVLPAMYLRFAGPSRHSAAGPEQPPAPGPDGPPTAAERPPTSSVPA